MELAAFCALNGLGDLISLVYQGSPEDLLWVEAVADRVETELLRARSERR